MAEKTIPPQNHSETAFVHLHPSTNRPIDPATTPLGIGALATLLHHKSTWVLRAIKGAPDTPFRGRFTTYNEAVIWIAAHPGFRARDCYDAQKAARAEQQRFSDKMHRLSS